MTSMNVQVGQEVCGVCGHGTRVDNSTWCQKLYNMCVETNEVPTEQLKIYAGHHYHPMCLDKLNDQEYLKLAPRRYYPGCLDGITVKNYKKLYEELRDGSRYYPGCLDGITVKNYKKLYEELRDGSRYYPGCLDGITVKNYKKLYEELQDGSRAIKQRAETILQNIEAEHLGLRPQPTTQPDEKEGDNRNALRERTYQALTERDYETMSRDTRVSCYIALAVCVVVGGLMLFGGNNKITL